MLPADAARCAIHAASIAQVLCHRCGSYACANCWAPGLRTEPLCVRCDDHTASQHCGRVASAARILRSGLIGSTVGLLSVTLGSLLGFPFESIVMDAFMGLLSVSYVVSAVTWCVWFRRTNRSLRARGLQLRYGPNAWGWFFVPLFFLWKPYRAVAELHVHATNSPGTPRWAVAWWSLLVLAIAVTPGGWTWHARGTLDYAREVLGAVLMAGAAVSAQAMVNIITGSLRNTCETRTESTNLG